MLPLANLSGDPEEEYLADGMTEALITDLSRIRSVRVVSRTSVMRYKGAQKPRPEIARELGVDGVVEGSVLRSGGRVRITAQLIRASDDRHLWAERYDRELRDILAVQGAVAQARRRNQGPAHPPGSGAAQRLTPHQSEGLPALRARSLSLEQEDPGPSHCSMPRSASTTRR